MELHNYLPGARVLDDPNAPYFAALTFDEHGDYSAQIPHTADSERVVGEFYNLFRSAMSSGLVEARVEYTSSGSISIRISCDSNVGFCSGDDGQGRRFFIRVQPKVAPEMMLQLGQLADVLPPLHDGDVYLEKNTDSPLDEWTLRAFQRALINLLNGGGLRSRHVTVDAELRNKMRGRLRLPKYLNNIGKGRWDSLPVTYPSLELDNRYNRQLLSVVRLAGVLSRINPATLDLVDRFQAAERRFAGVKAEPLTKASRLWPSNLPLPLQHYRAALQFGQMVLDQSSYDAQQGPLRASGVNLDMNTVYERAFFGGLRLLVPTAEFKEGWQVSFQEATLDDDCAVVKLGERSTNLSYIPDIVVPPSSELRTMIFDTKWKRNLASDGRHNRSEPGPPSPKAPSTEDVFQMTSYAMEALRSLGGREPHGCVAVLVYPTLEDGSTWATEYVVGDRTITIVVTGWHLSLPLMASIEGLWKKVRAVASRRSPI